MPASEAVPLTLVVEAVESVPMPLPPPTWMPPLMLFHTESGPVTVTSPLPPLLAPVPTAPPARVKSEPRSWMVRLPAPPREREIMARREFLELPVGYRRAIDRKPSTVTRCAG